MTIEPAGEHHPSPTALLSVEDLSLRFAGVKALSGIFFQVPVGELFAVIGPNGAGKTSLFNVLSRVYQPSEGRITFDGHDLLRLKTHQVARIGIARTFQNLGQFPNMSVLDYLLLGRHTHMRSTILSGGLYTVWTRREERTNRAYCLHLLDLLDLSSQSAKPLASLPYGLQKRADLARALAMEPRLLLLDEPVAGMNAEETEEIATILVEIQEQLGVTQILVEHDMAMVMGIADRVLVLDFGKIIALGTPAEVQANPEVITAYLGDAPGTGSDMLPHDPHR